MRKKFTNHSARKPTLVSQLKKANIVSSDIAKVKGHRGINFLNDYDEADEEERRRLSLAISKWDYENPSAEKKQIMAVSDITTTVAPLAHRWQRRKKTNCLLHFRVLNLKNFSINPAMMGSQEQTLRNLRTKTKFTTTTSVDGERTGTRTSVSAGKRKLKMQSVGRSTTATLNVTINVKLWCSFAPKFFP